MSAKTSSQRHRTGAFEPGARVELLEPSSRAVRSVSKVRKRQKWRAFGTHACEGEEEVGGYAFREGESGGRGKGSGSGSSAL